LTFPSAFGRDPLGYNVELVSEREKIFRRKFNVTDIFGRLVNGHSEDFKSAVKFYAYVSTVL